MATLAVFGVLAGGLAVAKGGGDTSIRSGTVHVAHGTGGKFKTIVSVPGLGKVQGACSTVDEVSKIAWKDTDGQQWLAYEQEGNSSFIRSSEGERHAYELNNIKPTIHFHVFLTRGDDEPQTTVTASVADLSDGCARFFAAEAVSTE